MNRKLFFAMLLCVILLASCSSAPTQTQPSTHETESQSTEASETTSIPTETEQSEISITTGNLKLSLAGGTPTEQDDNGNYSIKLRDQKAYLSIITTDVSEMGNIADSFVYIQHKTITEARGEAHDEKEVNIPIAGFTAEGEMYNTTNDNGIFLQHIDVSFTDSEYAYTFIFFCNGQDENWEEYTKLYSDVLDSAEYLGKYTPETTPETSETVSSPLGTVENPYKSGMYKVGVDLPAGEYLFIATGTKGYVCVSSDSNQDDIIENENFEYSFLITVSDGQYLQAKRCEFVTAEDHTVKTNGDGSFSAGMYRVGKDIPAGEYKLATDESNRGYYCIYNGSEIPFDIINNDNFEGSTYVTVVDGQYLILNRCTATPA